jgi:hypothetical protein
MHESRRVPEGVAAHVEDGRLTELRELLLKPEQAKIEELDKRFSSPEMLAEQVGEVLARAVSSRGSPDDKLALVLGPVVESAIRTSVRSNPRFFADILYPVMGPAIRKSIAEALRAMIESFNSSLEMTFSWKSLKWRLEAMRTGRPFAEVVLLHTLVYRVEQLYLLHRGDGLVLRYLSVEGTLAQDADLVSGMLTAIQDFVHDSFGGADDALETFRVGELGVFIEQGPSTVLAAVVRGNPPAELSAILRTQLELIELKFGRELEVFCGDSAPFDRADVLLEPCLIFAQTGKMGRASSGHPRDSTRRLAATRSSKDRLVLVMAMLSIVAIAIFAIIALTS